MVVVLDIHLHGRVFIEHELFPRIPVNRVHLRGRELARAFAIIALLIVRALVLFLRSAALVVLNPLPHRDFYLVLEGRARVFGGRCHCKHFSDLHAIGECDHHACRAPAEVRPDN